MKKAYIIKDKESKEKVLLVVIDFKQKVTDWTVDETKKEMKELVIACGGEVVESIGCRITRPSASFFISEGKLQEIINLTSINDIDTVIFSHDLKGNQQRNLEEMIKRKTIDRTQLILDIFAKHATSNEGKMQVELAQLQYLLPRLVGKGIDLSRLGGGIGTLGPGETKLEVDRRRISHRIAKLKRNLNDVADNRSLKRKKRKDQNVPAISLVGYTNAGKSALLNTLTQANQVTKDGLFTTLDSLSRQYMLPNHQKVILSDTVGFMNDLPHHLIEAFRATLEEVKDADLLLHILDISQPNFYNLYEAVLSVLKRIEAFDKPIITVLNKIDKLEGEKWIRDLQENFDNAVALSAKTGINISELLDKIAQMLSSLIIEINVDVPIKRMDLVNLAHEAGQVYSIKYYNDKINIRASVPSNIAGKFYK
jgi:GTPase